MIISLCKRNIWRWPDCSWVLKCPSQHVFLRLHSTKSKQTGHVWETFTKKRRKLGLPLGFSYHIPKPWSWCIAWSFFSLRQKKKPEKNRIWISTVCKTQTNLTSCNHCLHQLILHLLELISFLYFPLFSPRILFSVACVKLHVFGFNSYHYNSIVTAEYKATTG